MERDESGRAERSKDSSGVVRLPRITSTLSATKIGIFYLIIIFPEVFLVFKIANEELSRSAND